MFVTRRKGVCILWKMEGEVRVSEGEIPSEFEWWNTTCAHARAQEDLLHSQGHHVREYGMRLKRSSYVFVTLGAIEVCNAYSGTSKSGIRGFGRVNGHVLASGTRTFDPAAQKGRSSGSSLG